MEITIKENGTGLLCTLAGRLDTPASLQASKDIQPLLDNADKEIILDCSDLEYISSSGLRILLGAVFFLISDALLALNVFKGVDFPFRHAVVMATYLLAEWLLVSGMVRNRLMEKA